MNLLSQLDIFVLRNLLSVIILPSAKFNFYSFKSYRLEFVRVQRKTIAKNLKISLEFLKAASYPFIPFLPTLTYSDPT